MPIMNTNLVQHVGHATEVVIVGNDIINPLNGMTIDQVNKEVEGKQPKTDFTDKSLKTRVEHIKNKKIIDISKDDKGKKPVNSKDKKSSEKDKHKRTPDAKRTYPPKTTYTKAGRPPGKK